MQYIQILKEKIPPEIKIIAVSKYASLESMQKVYALGFRHFGESRVQEAKQKKIALSNLSNIVWHLTGHLQKNKIKTALEIFDYIHSVDTFELLSKIQEKAQEINKKPKLFLQIKLAFDPSKSGFEPNAEFFEILKQIANFKNIQIVGLMTILPQNTQLAFELFSELFEIKQKINTLKIPNIFLSELSMGMSEDYSCAIKAGATMLRLGRAIFENI